MARGGGRTHRCAWRARVRRAWPGRSPGRPAAGRVGRLGRGRARGRRPWGGCARSSLTSGRLGHHCGASSAPSSSSAAPAAVAVHARLLPPTPPAPPLSTCCAPLQPIDASEPASPDGGPAAALCLPDGLLRVGPIFPFASRRSRDCCGGYLRGFATTGGMQVWFKGSQFC